jgi:hypothetical protein
MLRALTGFLKNERAQDLAEYCLITALFALIALGIFWRVSGGLRDVGHPAATSISVSQPQSGGNAPAATAPPKDGQ